ncbi:MAG: ComEC/Rec2 family competence protein [Patescibacteria group bacterium]
MRLRPAKIFFYLNLLFILIIFLLGFRPGAFQPEITERSLAYYNGRRLSLTGRVCEEADLDYKSRRLTVCVNGQENGRVLVTTNLYPAYDYGDFLRLTGTLQAPAAIDDFDYASYLSRYDIYSLMYYPRAEWSVGRLTWPQSAYRRLLNGKQRLKSMIDASLPEPSAGLADAILLGYRRTVNRSDLDIFARVGLSHLIAISGSHITILSAMIINFFLALGFSRRWTTRLVFIFLIAYPLITGLAASAVRSAIMGGLAFLAVYYGRANSLIRALVFSAAVMLAFNPRLLRDDIGFQLSFLALLGIIYLYPLGRAMIRHLTAGLGWPMGRQNIITALLDTANLTMSCQLAILPVALINFHQLSLIAPLANILVLWTFPPLLASLIGGLLLSAILPALSPFWFLPAYLLLKFIFVVSGLLAAPSLAAVNVDWFNWWCGAEYYGLLAGLVYFLKKITAV